MRAYLILICMVNVSSLTGQRIEVFSGANKNSFFGNEGLHESSYSSGVGFSAGIAVDSLVSGILRTRFTLQFDSYGGSLKVDEGGTSHAQVVEASVNKSILGLCFFPLNVRLNKFDFNLGMELGGLIHEKYSGVLRGFDPYRSSYSYDLNEKYKRFSSKMYLGIKVRIAYDIYISKAMAISPQYLFYLGLSPEFSEFPQVTRSRRHYVCLGIRKKIHAR